ncbi:hypothetical protein SH1V18_21720 [Vallitalea longa]|uniref:non-reducing end alpha-L-arabinofuranosidase n=1 Tax=Vallitalea longa TaxID=2936439 RepID=A0A9W5Y9E3_9FIRM|nr:alpha-L-arabinofuranosidase C-terminal domain-containing protein [Vallitalea longa]GKX29692.1 hypothetical protein SH1V18_21720 [Vallitalea longa]
MFKKNLEKCLLLMLLIICVTASIPTIAVSASSIAISVDANDVQHKISPYLFGVNHRVGNAGYRTWDTSGKGNGELYEPVVNSTKYIGTSVVRWTGGSINNTVRWQDGIGDWKTRGPWISPFGENKPYNSSYGITEHMKFVESLGNDATSIMVVPVLMVNEQEAADYVEYMNSSNDGSNPNGGIDWASKRAEDGHEEPYAIEYWELGNEQFGNWTYRWTDEAEKYANGGEETYTPGQIVGSNKKMGYAVKYYDWSDHESDGTADQEWYTVVNPIKEGSETVKVGLTTWIRVNDLANAGIGNYYEFDYDTGNITFGDGVNGNIPKSGETITVGYTVVKPGANALAAAMKAVDPNIKICFGEFAGNYMGDNIDAYVKHPYKHISKILKGKTFYYDILNKAKYTKTNEYGKEPVLSEWGIFDQNVKGPSGYEGHILKSLTASLFNSKFLFSLIENGSVKYALRHMLNTSDSDDTQNTSYSPDNGLIAPVEEGTYVNANALPFKMFRERLSENYITTTINGSPSALIGKVQLVEAVSAVNNDKTVLDIIVNNYDASDDYSVNINLDNFDPYTQAEVWTLNGSSIYTYNDSKYYDRVKITGKTIDNASSNFNYIFPAHSMTAIRFHKDEGGLPSSPVMPEKAPKPFTDFIDTFNGDTVEVKPPSFNVTNDGDCKATIQEIPTIADKSVQLSDNGLGNTDIIRNFTPIFGEFSINTKVMTSDSMKTVFYNMRDDCGTQGPTLKYEFNCLKYRDSNGNWNDICSIVSNTWYNIHLDVNISNNTYDVLVNNELKVQKAEFYNNIDHIKSVRFTTHGPDKDYSFFLSELETICNNDNVVPPIIPAVYKIEHKSTGKILQSNNNNVDMTDPITDTDQVKWEKLEYDATRFHLNNIGNDSTIKRLHSSSDIDWDVNLVEDIWSGANVQWKLIDAGEGWSRIQHISSGMWLHYNGTDSVNLVNSNNTGDNTKWRFIRQ